MKVQSKQSQQCNKACGSRPTPSVGGFHLLQEQESQRTGKSKGKFWKTVFLGDGVLTQAFNKKPSHLLQQCYSGVQERKEKQTLFYLEIKTGLMMSLPRRD